MSENFCLLPYIVYCHIIPTPINYYRSHSYHFYTNLTNYYWESYSILAQFRQWCTRNSVIVYFYLRLYYGWWLTPVKCHPWISNHDVWRQNCPTLIYSHHQSLSCSVLFAFNCFYLFESMIRFRFRFHFPTLL